MKQTVTLDQTDYTVLVLIRDTAGAPKTGLTFESAGLDFCYTRVETDNDVVLTAGAPVTQTLTGGHSDWGFVEVDATNAPGVYRLDLPDGVFATGAWTAVVSLIGTGLDPTHLEFQLVSATALSVDTIADAVWDESRADHSDPGTFGDIDQTSTLVDAIWDEQTSDHATAGTTGLAVAGGAGVSADDIWDEVVEGTTTMRQLMRGFASALLSKVSGGGTTTITFRDLGDTKNRIVATVDANGNRSAVTLTLT